MGIFDPPDEDRVRPEIKALIARGNVTPEELSQLRMNSWERDALVPALSDEAFIERFEHALSNCFTTRARPFTTYNQAVEGLYAPELLRRFRLAVLSKLRFDQIKNNGILTTSSETRVSIGSSGPKRNLSGKCQACSIEAEIGTEEDPHPVPPRFHTCSPPATTGDAILTLESTAGVAGGDPSECPDCGAWHVAPGACPSKTRPHIVDGEFQSDKYPATPRGKVPLSTKDPMAQDLLWKYAQRRRLVDAEFADDLEFALRSKGYDPQ